MIWWCTFAEISPSKIIARILNISLFHCVKSVRILSFSGSYFPTFAPEKLWIWTLFKQRYFTITSANPIKWSNTLKQFVGKFPTNCLSVFDHFAGLGLKSLIRFCWHFTLQLWKKLYWDELFSDNFILVMINSFIGDNFGRTFSDIFLRFRSSTKQYFSISECTSMQRHSRLYRN